MIKFLPCCKETEGSQRKIYSASKPLNNQEQMDALLNMIPNKLAVAYWAKVKAESFPASVRELLADLKAVEPKWRQETSLNERLSGRHKGKQPGQGGNSSKGRIPRKDCGRTSNNSGGPQANANPNPKKQGGAKQKLCQRCAQWSP